jgi:hypothetical protein
MPAAATIRTSLSIYVYSWLMYFCKPNLRANFRFSLLTSQMTTVKIRITAPRFRPRSVYPQRTGGLNVTETLAPMIYVSLTPSEQRYRNGGKLWKTFRKVIHSNLLTICNF